MEVGKYLASVPSFVLEWWKNGAPERIKLGTQERDILAKAAAWFARESKASPNGFTGS
jgi:hypothetical protein